MDSSVQASQDGGASKPKPGLAPKPRLTPKPFSLQKTTAIRSIHAPKTIPAALKSKPDQTGKSDVLGVPKPTLTSPAQKSPQPASTSDPKPSSVSVPPKPQPKPTKTTEAGLHEEGTQKSDPVSQTTPSKETPKSEPIQKDDVVHTNHKECLDIVTKPGSISDPKPSSVSVPIKTQPTTTKISEAGLHKDSTAEKSDPVPQTTPPKQTPKSEPIQGDDVVHTNHKESVDIVTKPPSISDPKPSSVSVPTKTQPKTSESGLLKDGTLDSSAKKSGPVPQTTSSKQQPKSEPIQKDDVIQTNHEASVDIVTRSEQKDGKKKEETQASVVQKPEETGNDGSSAASPAYRRGSERKRLSMELTSKFESGGLSLPPQPTKAIFTTNMKDESKKPEPEPESSRATPDTSNRESDEGEKTEEYVGGGSIKRRISLLFDSSSRPEVMAKREEPEIINGTGGVKERIKNWTAESNPEGPKTEKKPQVAPRTRSKSSEPAAAPAAEKTPQCPTVEPPALETSPSPPVDPILKVSPAEQPTETPLEISKDAPSEDKSVESTAGTPKEQNKSPENDVQLRSCFPSTANTANREDDSVGSEGGDHAIKRNNVKRRSVRFGVVERDDGGPPLILGSASDSSSEEEKDAQEDETDEEVLVSVPVYKRVGILQKKNDEIEKEEEERLKHLEFEKRRRAEEHKQAKLQLEEEQKREEEERERQKARQKEEEEKQREALRQEEMERQRKEEWERERLEEEEREKKRLREEEMERQKQMEIMLQRQKEEERERAKQEEERLKQEEERLKQEQEEREKERLKEEKRKEERLREERERQSLREEEERLIHEQEEHRLERKLMEEEMNIEKQREEEWEKEWVKMTERLKGDERDKEREKEEERARERQKEEREKERLREEAEERERRRRLEEDDRMRERQRQEEEERKRRELERKMEQEREEEMERLRQMEKQREEERREEERKRQIEKERVEELERTMREELERKQADELKEQLRMEEERKREELELTSREPELAADKEEQSLISFDDDLAPKPEATYFPSAKIDEPSHSLIDVVYDDFSVKMPQIDVDFDDFSVKPRRRALQPKPETTTYSWAVDLMDKEEEQEEEEELLVPLDVTSQEYSVSEQVEKPDSPEPTPAQEDAEEEEVEVEEAKERPEEEEVQAEEEKEKPGEQELISVEVEEEEKEAEREEEEDKQEVQVNSFPTNVDDKDTDALIDSEPDQQNGVCEPASETNSPKLVPDQVLDVSSEDVDTTDFHKEPELAPFPESSTPLLDTSAQRSRADLGKRRIRSRPSRMGRTGMAQTERLDWRAHDSTEPKETTLKQRESDSDEDQPPSKTVSSLPPSSNRVPVFPGLSPAALLARRKKKTSEGATLPYEEKAREEKEIPNEEAAPSPSQLSRSPRSASLLAGAARVLPPIGGKDGGAVSSPAWLKELKSKKRMSQHDGDS